MANAVGPAGLRPNQRRNDSAEAIWRTDRTRDFGESLRSFEQDAVPRLISTREVATRYGSSEALFLTVVLVNTDREQKPENASVTVLPGENPRVPFCEGF